MTSADTRRRLLDIVGHAEADLASAALARLWPGYLSTRDMLDRLPRPDPDRLGDGWSLIQSIPRLLQPADLTDALAWVSNAMSIPGYSEHNDLAVRIVAWAVRTCDTGADHADAAVARLAQSVCDLARSGDIHLNGLAFHELSDEFTRRHGLRRAVARHVLELASGPEIGILTVGSALGIFPRGDAAFWAAQLPSLPPGLHEQLRFPLREAPADAEEWAAVWELAEGNALIRSQTAHWYVLPIQHPRGSDARSHQAAKQRDHARRQERRYDEPGLRARLAALIAGEVPARRGWLEVIADLFRTPEGDPVVLSTRLDLSCAPAFPAPGTDLFNRLALGAGAALRNAPLMTTADIDPARADLTGMPELWALSLLAEARLLEPGRIEPARWTGLTLGLLCISIAPDDHGRCSGMVKTGILHGGSLLEESISGFLGRVGKDRLYAVLSRLAPALTPGLTSKVLSWAGQPEQTLAQWEIVQDVLARYGYQDVINDLRRTVAVISDQGDPDPGSPDVPRWLGAASILARYDTSASWPVISARIAAAPDLARPLLDRLAEHSDSGNWPIEIEVLQASELAGLYDLIAEHGPDAHAQPQGLAGRLTFGPEQKLVRMCSRLPQILASRATREADAELYALASRHPGNWQLTELARLHARDLAARAWRPLELIDLLKLADDDALRLVRDERQLSDVVTESLTRLQTLLSAPNGWATLLWHRADSYATTGWWPTWEDDLSDLVATFLQHDLAARQVIVNREVQILRPGLDGRRTDVHVQAGSAMSTGEPEPLTVIVECKGCWNREMPTGLDSQLVSKYLATPGRSAGIYLIGYFDCSRWNHKMRPGREHTSHELADVMAEHARIADLAAARESVPVTAFVLDCRLAGSALIAPHSRNVEGNNG